MVPLVGLRVYPMLQLTVKTEPVEPPFEGEILTAFVMECVPVQLLAGILKKSLSLHKTMKKSQLEKDVRQLC